MRAFNLVPLLFLPVAWSIPAGEFQEVLGELADLPELESIWADISTEAAHAAHAWTSVEKTIQKGEEKIEQWVEEGKEFVKQDGLVCECLKRPLRPRWLSTRVQTSSSRIPRSRTTSSGSLTLLCVMSL